MSSRRSGRGRPINQQAWPPSGARRDWLAYCDRVHQANGLPSLGALATAMGLTSRSRVGELLRGLALPDGQKQARTLLEALGAVGAEVDRGIRRFQAARAEQDQAARGADRPDWWLRSGYIQQVGDIAPLHLLDRQGEMDELATWCTGGDEAYVWWQAEPRAGKSALMAWFVLHPPPDVWVISFFVTARYASQADSVAFTDELIDQLSAITGQQIPPVTSATARDRLRRQLLSEAAARAAKAGRRLVLVVDGLDEDCGSLPGSGLPSIAACLPKRPPNGLRVIVVGRPDPPLPADVAIDAGHPLHRCRIRRLDASLHARQVMQLAQDELDEVLATDRTRHDGLGYEVLGLVTACSGGLDQRDLQQLTGRAAFEIDRLLRGVFGRTIAGRVDPHTTERVFLFAHETLRTQAVDRLGPHTLAGFVERLHTWAGIYINSGWPLDTPAYLLRGYPRMLADTKDLDRLVGLATDPARHDRMLDLTGGDAAALAEINTALELVRADSDLGLLTMARLSIHRHSLAARNTNIPTNLPAVWATLGQQVRAEALAHGIANAYRRAQALTQVAQAVAAIGDPDRAEQIARSITDPDEKAQALTQVAQAVAGAGDMDRAESLAYGITGPYRQAQALAQLARVVAATGAPDRADGLVTRAEALAHSINDRYLQAQAAVARAVLDASDLDRAERLATRAEALAHSINDPYLWAQALAQLARVVTATGDLDRVEQIVLAIADPDEEAQALAQLAGVVAATGDLNQAERIARAITDPDEKAQALTQVAQAVAGAGDMDRAESLAYGITDPYRQAQALAQLARVVASAGDMDRAERIARSITHPDEKAQALAQVAQAVAGAGDMDRAGRLATQAESIARAITDPDSQAQALVKAAWAAAGAGDMDRAGRLAIRAESIAQAITDPYRQAQALVEAAWVVAATDDADRAESHAQGITDPYRQAQALAQLARVVAGAGDMDRARRLAIRAERIARAITDPDSQAQALVKAAWAAAGAGDMDRAGRLATRAERIAQTIIAWYNQARTLAQVAQVVAATGDLTQAERIARAITHPDKQAQALAQVAQAVASAGDMDRAGRLATQAKRIAQSYPHSQASLVAVAKAVDAVGDRDWAERIARAIADPDKQAQALAEVALVDGLPRGYRLLGAAFAAGSWLVPLPVLAKLRPQLVIQITDEVYGNDSA
jgi:hypothetical protein